jgi:carbamoyltransferase
MKILGLNVYHADSAACIVVNGKIISAVEEERFERIKHFGGFPFNSIKFCLNNSSYSIEDIDYIAVNFKKSYNLKRKLTYLFKNPFFVFKKIFFSKKKNVKKFVKVNFPKFKGKIIYVPHHISHIASSYLCSGFDNAIGLSIDGSGDFSTVESYQCEKNNYKLLSKVNFPHSLGIFYQAFTEFLGFSNYGDEFKVMGLASLGNPVYVDKILNNIIYFDGEMFNLNLDYFRHHTIKFNDYFLNGIPSFNNIFSSKIIHVFGKPRVKNENITEFHKDLAASVQKVFETIIICLIKNIAKKYNQENLVLSGGCFFNSVLNGKIQELGLFKQIYVSPNVGDAGGALGAALYTSSLLDKNFVNKKIDNFFLGSCYNNSYIQENIISQKNLTKLNINYEFLNNEQLYDRVSEYLLNKKTVGWFQDRMEWGPRALGNRSILAHPQDVNLKNKINLIIKNREDFRPFAPAIINDHVQKYVHNNVDSFFMTYVSKSRELALKHLLGAVHVDKTCRFQTVKEELNYKFYNLINSFYKKTGIPAVLNTSLNINEPICENPMQALDLFIKSPLDVLVLQNWILKKF